VRSHRARTQARRRLDQRRVHERFSTFADLTPAEYQRITAVSYLGYVYGTMPALRRMRQRDRGGVQVGSALAYREHPASSDVLRREERHPRIHGLVRCELVHDRSNVRITMALMPAVNTPQFAWSRREPTRSERPSNLLPTTFGPSRLPWHVDDRAISSSWFTWLMEHRTSVFRAVAAAVGIAIATRRTP
jgi:NAD(P)-dependent dehydrogenase (short-subunit alcohol dehydrogenase family)